jgi:hypothetical protein
LKCRRTDSVNYSEIQDKLFKAVFGRAEPDLDKQNSEKALGTLIRRIQLGQTDGSPGLERSRRLPTACRCRETGEPALGLHELPPSISRDAVCVRASTYTAEHWHLRAPQRLRLQRAPPRRAGDCHPGASPFRVKKSDIHVISRAEERLFGWISVNTSSAALPAT